MMKIYDRKLAYPYFVWMTLFTVVPLIIVVYYALTASARRMEALWNRLVYHLSVNPVNSA